MHTLNITRAVAVLLAGLIAGIFVANLAGLPARGSLDTPNYIQYLQFTHLYYKQMMPPITIAAIVAGTVWLVFLKNDWQSAEFVLGSVALLFVIATFTVTLTINIPINNQLMTWNPTAPPADFREIWARWETATLYRTLFSIIGAIFSVLALCAGKSLRLK